MLLAAIIGIGEDWQMRDSPNNGVNTGPGLCGRGLSILLAAVLLASAQSTFADLWYEHYAQAELALEQQEWAQVVEEINAALEKKGDSGARVRSYGMKVTAYFPYLKLGIAYYHLGELDAALQAFETESRLGAIAESDVASAELIRYRTLALDAQLAAEEQEQERIRHIVRQSLDDAEALQASGQLDEAMAALDRALAVAPDDDAANLAMDGLRARYAERERNIEGERRVADLIERGRSLLRDSRYSEASSVFREAMFMRPSTEVQSLLDEARQKLLVQLEAAELVASPAADIGARLEEVRALETTGRVDTALERLQSILALEPGNDAARSIQDRLLEQRKQTQAAHARHTAIAALLSDAASKLDDGLAEDALVAANRALALDPGNADALQHVSRAYAVISRELLGAKQRTNIPPALRFVDLRQETDDGLLVQTVDDPDFRLNGVIIDNSPVDLIVYSDDGQTLDVHLEAQPLGEFFVVEFSASKELTPGLESFWLVATDAEEMVSSSEYLVMYARPLFRTPWFYAALLGIALAIALAILGWRLLRRSRLRRRKFNPYVAGAPVLEDSMFFGRRELVDRILQTIHNNSLLIYGERRIGKTSIQHQLKKRLRDLDDPDYVFHPVYVDLQGTPESLFFRTIAEDVFQELEPYLDGLAPTAADNGDYTYRDFVGDLRAVFRALARHTTRKIRLVLLIDEVDELNDYDPRINQKLRSLFMKSFAENLVAVVSGVEIKKQWEREGSPWYNFFEEIEVKPLAPRDARQLIERPIGGVFKLDGGVADKIISLTAGKPYLIQKLCVSLVTRLHEQHRRRITLADVEAVARPGEA